MAANNLNPQEFKLFDENPFFNGKSFHISVMTNVKYFSILGNFTIWFVILDDCGALHFMCVTFYHNQKRMSNRMKMNISKYMNKLIIEG